MPERPPNILWICTDSQRWDTLGCYGNPFVSSPNLDRLAAEGVLFEHAYAQNPLCTPSRGSFLTGRYPVTNRLRQNGQPVPLDLKPITRTLRDDAGFVCGLSGKLHLGNCDRRFTLGEVWWKRPDQDRLTPVERRIDDGYDVFHWCHGSQDNPYSAYAQWLHQKGVVNGFGDWLGEELGPQVRYGMPPDQSNTAFCADKAIEFIELHHAKGFTHPWLFSVNMVDPHPDFHPPKEFLEPYLDRLDEIPLPDYEEGELDNKPAHQRDTYAEGKAHATRDLTDRDLRLMKAAYWAMCDHIDQQVGLMLDALERTGQRENTLIIFSSDHGELLGDHGRTWKGPYLYDPCIRVPLIISMPGTVAQGIRAGGLVELTDLAPTVLDAAGLPPDRSMQGRSLWPVLTGNAPADSFRDDIYCEYYNSNPNKTATWLTMLRTDRYKLIAFHSTLEGELYDLEKDATETVNRWDDPEYRNVKTELLQRLCARMAFTADPMPERLGVY